MQHHLTGFGRGRAWAASMLISLSLPAAALDFSLGDYEGKLDTFVTLGVVQRLQSRDPGLVSEGNGGRRRLARLADRRWQPEL